jgi:hypothetical protein
MSKYHAKKNSVQPNTTGCGAGENLSKFRKVVEFGVANSDIYDIMVAYKTTTQKESKTSG